jgi:hypothetical protein
VSAKIAQCASSPSGPRRSASPSAWRRLGNKFPKHIYHTIVCIGALVAHRESNHWAVDALGAPHVGERTEKSAHSAKKSLR